MSFSCHLLLSWSYRRLSRNTDQIQPTCPPTSTTSNRQPAVEAEPLVSRGGCTGVPPRCSRGTSPRCLCRAGPRTSRVQSSVYAHQGSCDSSNTKTKSRLRGIRHSAKIALDSASLWRRSSAVEQGTHKPRLRPPVKDGSSVTRAGDAPCAIRLLGYDAPRIFSGRRSGHCSP